MVSKVVLGLAALTVGVLASTSAQALPTATADVLPAGRLLVAYAFVDEKPAGTSSPETLQLELACVGLGGRTQLDLMRFEPEGRSGQYQLWARHQFVSETPSRPALALGAQDVTREKGDTAFYLGAAKTVTPAGAAGPHYPVVRLYLGRRTDPVEGTIGGVRFRFSPQVGALVFLDGRKDLYYGSYTFPGNKVIAYAGKWGEATFAAVAYSISL